MPRQLRAQSVVRQYFVPTVPQANYMAAKQTSTAAWAGEESVRGGPVLLQNGGTAEVTDRRHVPMGDTRAYPGLTYVDPGDDDRPAVRIVFSVERGVPQCVGLSFTAAKESRCAAKTYGRSNSMTSSPPATPTSVCSSNNVTGFGLWRSGGTSGKVEWVEQCCATSLAVSWVPRRRDPRTEAACRTGTEDAALNSVGGVSVRGAWRAQRIGS